MPLSLSAVRSAPRGRVSSTRSLHRATTFALLAVVAVTATTCSSTSPTAPSAQTLAGTWRATRAEYVDRANANVRLEVVSQGATVVLVIDAAGTFTLTTTAPGAAPEVCSGTWSATSDVLTIRRTGVSGETQFDMTLNGNTLTLNGGHVLFDVNGDDVDEETVLNMTLARQ